MANIKLLWHCGEAGWKTRGDYKAISPTASQPAATSQPTATFYERREGRRGERKAGRSEEKVVEEGGEKGRRKEKRERWGGGGGGILNVKAKWDDWNEGGSGGGNKGEQVSQGMEGWRQETRQLLSIHLRPLDPTWLLKRQTGRRFIVIGGR